MKYFYFDEGKEKGIDGNTPKEATQAEVLAAWDAMSGQALSFLGIVNDGGVTLQFMWEEDGSMVIDVPVPERGGSWTKTTDVAECKEVIAAFYDGVDPTKIAGLVFEEW
ncbi:hypothetical protein LOC68_17170 [Blastopirellula sp. JC732]|uniref:Uncharacterized protein n=1 Tax=Blastopirellula sediminis TaxID=2894196 RepID=A0A9X1MQF2_9BACT|nr:hypothetical protein [Blastopirellula sediminis]MCC9606575.1 hypothetical protein [Blastopirellula sediminis]MCC9630127.1 hypothetical protein [Blastopirellula sediminis]